MCRSSLRPPMGSFYLLMQWFLKRQYVATETVSFPKELPLCALSLYPSSSRYHFICFSFVCAGSSLLVASGGYSALWCTGFSLQWLILLWNTGSRHAGFGSCGAWAQLPQGMWNPPGPRIKSVSPALAGELLTSGPGKVPITLISTWDLKFSSS